jgi:hypothetical protein
MIFAFTGSMASPLAWCDTPARRSDVMVLFSVPIVVASALVWIGLRM